MDSNSMKQLRLDQRLIRRRGWISKDELERELSALPDSSHKVAPQEDQNPEPGSAAPTEPVPGGLDPQ